MSKEYLAEMRKLELQEKQLRDRYNTEEESKDPHYTLSGGLPPPSSY